MATISSDVLAYRIGEAERDIEKKADKDYVDEIAREVKGLRDAVYKLLAGIVGSSVLVSFTLFATLGAGVHIGG